MPLYEYAIVLPDGSDGATFEVLQTLSEPALTTHPDTGEPVRRLLGTPNAPKRWADANGRATLSSGNLARHGFTQYKNAGGGVYEKTAGAGPDTISRD
jgi:hypothetical protein